MEPTAVTLSWTAPRTFSRNAANWITVAVMLLTVLVLLTGWPFNLLANASDKRIVVFTANWCANCREVVPIAQQVGAEKGYVVTLIDVDSGNAPKEAKAAGLEIPSRDLPQVYVLGAAGPQLIFDGKGYFYGQGATAKNRLNQGMP